jgi:hypothetical protein
MSSVRGLQRHEESLRKGQVGGGKRKRVIPYGDCRRNGVPFREVNQLLPSKDGSKKVRWRDGKDDGVMIWRWRER